MAASSLFGVKAICSNFGAIKKHFGCTICQFPFDLFSANSLGYFLFALFLVQICISFSQYFVTKSFPLIRTIRYFLLALLDEKVRIGKFCLLIALKIVQLGMKNRAIKKENIVRLSRELRTPFLIHFLFCSNLFNKKI